MGHGKRLKTCTKCGQEEPLEYFDVSKGFKDGGTNDIRKIRVPIFIAYQDKDGYHEVIPPKYELGINIAKSCNTFEIY